MYIKRDWEDSSWTSAGGARWAFFAIFIVLVVLIIIGTIRVNKKRSRQGIQPIYGTRWITPPSYFQSQNQYNQPNGRNAEDPSTYVPTYTATANEFDMGYYDPQGNFHPNPNAKKGDGLTNDVQFPDSVHHRSSVAQNGQPVNNIPNNSAGNVFTDEHHSRRNSHDNDSLGDIQRPTGPPPGQTTSR